MMGAHVLRAGVNRHIIDLRGARLHRPHRHERRRRHPRLRTGAHRRHHRKRGPLHPHRRVRPVARNRRAERLDPRGRRRLASAWARTSAAASSRATIPHRDLSRVRRRLPRCGVPVTVHVGIGYDILHEHPNCDGAALGAASYRDFLIFARTVERLEGGVLLNFGSAIMGPEVYLKALAMARNVAHQEGRAIRHFTTAVFDLVPDPRRLPQGTAQDRSRLLLPPAQDHPGAHRGRRRRELLFLRRAPRHPARPVARC